MKKHYQKHYRLKVPEYASGIDSDAGKRMLEEIVHESTVVEILGVTKKILDLLRYERNFPHVNIMKGCRVYLRSSVLRWLKENEIEIKRDGKIRKLGGGDI